MKSVLSFFSGGGEVGAQLRGIDWERHVLGSAAKWPSALRTLVEVMLAANQPMFVAWGDAQTLLYNDGYALILAQRHPHALGRPFFEVWPEVRDVVEPILARAYAGEPTYMDDIRLDVARRGYSEEAHFSFFYAPVRDDARQVAGVFCACTETTDKVLAERRAAAENARQRRLFDAAPGFVAILFGPDHVFEFVNRAYVRMLGGRELIGQTVRVAVPEVEGQGFLELLDRVYRSGQRFVAHDMPMQLIAEGGAVEDLRLDFVYEPVTDASGRVTGIFVQGSDVTAAYQAREAVRRSNARYSNLLNSMSEGFVVLDEEFRVIEVNDEALQIDGRPADQILGRSHWELWPGSPGTPVEEAYRRAMRERVAVHLEHHYAAGSHDVWLDLRIYPVAGGLAAFYRDISDVKRAAQALRHSDDRFRAAIDAIGVLWTNTADGRMLGHQPGWSELTGQTEAEYRDHGWAAAVHPDDAAPTLAAWNHAVAARHTFIFEHRLKTRHGEWRSFAIRAVPVLDPTGLLREWVGVHIDITDQRAAQVALAELNRTLEQRVAERTAERDTMWQLSEDLLFVASFDGQLLAANPASRSILGFEPEQLVGRPLRDLMHPDDVAATEAARVKVEAQRSRIVNRYRTAAGGYRVVSWSTAAGSGGIYGVGRDITDELAAAKDLERAQAALRQSQKMEAVGQLTGGIAHDFNNVLQAVNGNLQLIRRVASDPERVKRWAESGLRSVDRGAKLTSQLLTFSRLQQLEVKAVPVTALLGGMAELLARAIGPSVQVTFDLAATEHDAVLADPTQLEVAVLNLAINARDAMSEGGQVAIATAPRRFAQDPELPPGDYIEIRVTDTGPGMPADVLERAFDPFFTTKPVGQGTGLGLSQVYGFSRQAGGTARIESRVGAGTTVRMLLKRAPVTTAEAEPPRTPDPSPSGRVEVLVVDDDAEVRGMMTEMLGVLGYGVRSAPDGATCLESLDERRPDLLVLDFAMPEMNGAEVARRARCRHPDLPIVFASGYADMAQLRAAVGDDAPILRKPFQLEELLAAIEAEMATNRVASSQGTAASPLSSIATGEGRRETASLGP